MISNVIKKSFKRVKEKEIKEEKFSRRNTMLNKQFLLKVFLQNLTRK